MGFLSKLFGGSNDRIEEMPEIRPIEERSPFRLTNIDKTEEGYYPITCPYCLEKFDIWEVEFRASIGSQAKDENNNNSYGSDSSSTAGLNLFGNDSQSSVVNETKNTSNKKEKKEELTAFPREIDKKKEAFLRKVGKIRGDADLRAEEKILKIFDDEGNATGEVERVLLMDDSGNQTGDWIYLEGRTINDPELYHAPIACVRDKYQHNSTRRVCPHCHNEISNLLGLYPNYVIGVVGNTFCGKSLYISKLKEIIEGPGILSQMSGYRFSGNGASYAAQEAKEIDDKARHGEVLLDPTRIEYIPPQTINCTRGSGESRTRMVITLFDFPGEALQKDKEITEFLDHYSDVAMNVNGWFFLFDSSSVNSVSRIVTEYKPEFVKFLPKNMIQEKDGGNPGDNEKRAEAVSMAPQAVLQSFADKILKGSFTVPVAFVITKSDILKEIQENIRYEYPDCMVPNPSFLNTYSYTNVDEVDLDEINQNSNDIQTMLGDAGLKDWVVLNAASHVKNEGECAWFTVSATGTAVAVGHKAAIAKPIRVEDPMAWMLYMLGVIPGTSQDENLWR